MPEAMDQLAAYMTAREEERQRIVGRALDAMTLREHRLVREAAVMGYVLGGLGPHRRSIPPDSEVVRQVIAACIAHGDLYPTISAMAAKVGH